MKRCTLLKTLHYNKDFRRITKKIVMPHDFLVDI